MFTDLMFSAGTALLFYCLLLVNDLWKVLAKSLGATVSGKKVEVLGENCP